MTKAGNRPDNYMIINTYHFSFCHFVGFMCDTWNNNSLTNKTKRHLHIPENDPVAWQTTVL